MIEKAIGLPGFIAEYSHSGQVEFLGNPQRDGNQNGSIEAKKSKYLHILELGNGELEATTGPSIQSIQVIFIEKVGCMSQELYLYILISWVQILHYCLIMWYWI